MSEQERKYQEVLVRFAKGEATREQVRAADPMRDVIKSASKMIAQSYKGTPKFG